MGGLAKIQFNDAKIDDLLITRDFKTVLHVVKSGDVMDSFSPESPVLKCIMSIGDAWEEDQITIDYFNSEFYGPIPLKNKDKLIKELIRLEKEHGE